MSATTATVRGGMRTSPVAPGRAVLDPESQELLQALKGSGRAYDDACVRLHELLLRAARFEVARRRRGLTGAEADTIATEAADDALPLEPETLGVLHGGTPGPEEDVEMRERLGKIAAAMDDVLTPHQRRVLVALAVNGVPIDVLAERLSTTRGALYKTLHDARAKLRAHMEETS